MRLLLAAALLLTTAAAPAQQAPAHHAPHSNTPRSNAQLKFVLILSRHGIRPPLKTNASLAPFAAQPWPAWEVGLGQLTPHGAAELRQLGRYLRVTYAAQHLLPATGCDNAHTLFLYSDVDQRDLATDRALDEGLFPATAGHDCPHTPIFAVAPGAKDPLFARTLLPAQSPAEAVASFQSRFPDPAAITTRFQPQLDLMTHVLAPDPAHPAQTSLYTVPPAIVPGSTTPGVSAATLRGPVFSATTMAEDIFLEYLNAMPMSDVGWGRVTPTQLRGLRALHAFAFRASYGDGYIGRAENSNLLAHFLDTLQAAATNQSLPGAIAPPSAKLVIAAGHDDNIVAFAGILGFHYTIDGIADEPAPGSQILFELWQNPRTHRQTVRLRVRIVPAASQRAAAPLTRTHPPREVAVKLPHCSLDCPLADFLQQARAALDPRFVIPTLVPAIAQEPPPAAPPVH